MTDHTDDPTEQYHFRDIRPGDIVHDLGQMGWPKMRVIRTEADSVVDYADERGTDMREYEKNALAGAQPDDRVFLATFVQDSPMKHAKTHYPVPESRLAKQDLMSEAEHIGDDYDAVFHPADQAVFEFLADFLTVLKSSEFEDTTTAEALDAAHSLTDYPAIIIDAADDLSHIRAQALQEADDEDIPDHESVEDAEADGESETSAQSDETEDDDLGDFDPAGDE